MQGDFSLGELAVRFGLELRGDPGLVVSHVATLSQAGPGALSFLANSRYRKQLASSHATAILIGPNDAAACPTAALIGPQPYLAYARIAALLHPPEPLNAGIHATAVVAAGARIAASAAVGPLCVIEPEVELGERVQLDAGCTIQRGARIGDDSRLMPRVTLYPGVRIGERCLLHTGAVIGADGFGFAPDSGTWVKVPQLGSVFGIVTFSFVLLLINENTLQACLYFWIQLSQTNQRLQLIGHHFGLCHQESHHLVHNKGARFP